MKYNAGMKMQLSKHMGGRPVHVVVPYAAPLTSGHGTKITGCRMRSAAVRQG